MPGNLPPPPPGFSRVEEEDSNLEPSGNKPRKRKRALRSRTRRKILRISFQIGRVLAILLILGGIAYGAYTFMNANGNFPPKLFNDEKSQESSQRDEATKSGEEPKENEKSKEKKDKPNSKE